MGERATPRQRSRRATPVGGVLRARVEDHLRQILELLGFDLNDPHFRRTPARVAEVFMATRLDGEPAPAMTTFPAHSRGLVRVGPIPVYSLCPHHFLPYFGEAEIAYVPRGRILGLSKFARLVEHLARRPQAQESLTSGIADELVRALDPVGVRVTLEARHLCLEMRGARKPGVRTTTVAARGRLPAAARTGRRSGAAGPRR